jgi:peptide/nickel transport system substrate-binding protein
LRAAPATEGTPKQGSRSYLSTVAKKDVKGVVRYLTRAMFFATTWLDR